MVWSWARPASSSISAGDAGLGGSAAGDASAKHSAISAASDVPIVHAFIFFSLRLLPRLGLLCLPSSRFAQF
jgi:hypothetical protein